MNAARRNTRRTRAAFSHAAARTWWDKKLARRQLSTGSLSSPLRLTVIAGCLLQRLRSRDPIRDATTIRCNYWGKLVPTRKIKPLIY
jgi:hypothetical protein